MRGLNFIYLGFLSSHNSSRWTDELILIKDWALARFVYSFNHSFTTYCTPAWVVLVVNLPASAGDATDPGSILGLGRSPRVGNGTPLQYSCPESSWAEEPGGLQSMGLQSVGHDWTTNHTLFRFSFSIYCTVHLLITRHGATVVKTGMFPVCSDLILCGENWDGAIGAGLGRIRAMRSQRKRN